MGKGRGSGRATIADVAERAGVSPITASRVLRTPEKVSADLRNRVLAAVAALGYAPDLNARALASARSDVIGVIVPSVTNNVFADVLKGLDDALGDRPYHVHFANSHFLPATEERLLAGFIAQKPAALIVSGIDQTAEGRRRLVAADCPVVQIMEIGPDPIDMMVGFSQVDAGATVARHLVEAGYRRIGFLGARMDPRTRRRFEGFRAGLVAAGLFDPDRAAVTDERSSVALGRRLLADLRSRRPETDAVFCNNDDIAMGALFECQAGGIAVPARMGIAGFNDLDIMGAACPTVTSLRTFRYDIGHRAMEMALAAAAGTRPAERVIDVGFALMARETTRRTVS